MTDSVNQQAWLDAFIGEINYYKEKLGERKIKTIFFGGGTPSLMPPETVERIISHVRKVWNVGNDIEVSIEANPSSSEIKNFEYLSKAGINRLSLGIQSFDDNRLKFLGRRHSAKEGLNAIEKAKTTFPNFSFDLIYNLPDQTKKELSTNLDIAFGFKSPHISLYQLTIEKGTQFFKDFREKKFQLPNDRDSCELYDFVEEKCLSNSLEKYEISNYSKLGHESVHNINYWEYGEYLGIGPGAHSRLDFEGGRVAIFDIHSPEKWLESVNRKGNGVQQSKTLDKEQLLSEIIFMGFRTIYGLEKSRFKKITGNEFDSSFDEDLIKDLEKEGYLINTKKKIKLTNEGMMMHSAIVRRFLVR